MKDKIGNAPAGLGALLILLLAVVAAALLGIQQLSRAWHWEKHSYEVLGELEAVLSKVIDAETGTRGYLISGNSSFLEPFNAARPQIDARVQKLRRLTIDNAGQQERLARLGPLITQRIAEADRVIVARANGDARAAQAQVIGGDDQRLIEAIRSVIAEMEHEEQRLLNGRGAAAETAVRRLRIVAVAGSALGLGIVATALVRMAGESRHRRQAEAAQRRTLGILNATHDGVFMFDARTLRFFYVNEGAVQQVGYRREELLGMTPLALEPELGESGYRARIAPLLDGALDARSLSTVYRRKNGAEVPVEMVLQSTETAAGERALVAIVRDSTERRQAEEVQRLYQEGLEAQVRQRTAELQAANEACARLAAIVESSEDAILSIALDGTLMTWNEGARRLFGYSAEEMVGQPVARLLPPDRLDEEAQILARLQRGERVNHYETVRRGKDGRLVEVSLSISPIRDGAGRITGASKIARDITERKAAEQALQESRARFEGIIHSAMDAVITMDGAGQILEFNPAAEKTFGYRRDEVRGKALVEAIIPPHLREAHRLGLARYLATGTGPILGKLIEITAMRANGMEFPVELTVTRMDVMAAPLFTGFIRDITERKRAEAELKALNETLEGRVRERTAEAERANRLKSEFLATMSHELRTPLNAILGFTELLIDGRTGPLSPTQAEYLDDVHASARHLLDLINDVLDLAKVEAGKMELRLEAFALAKALEEVCAVVKGIADKKGVSLSCVVAPDLGVVTLDEQKLKQVCYNLLSNAVKFTGAPGRVELRALPRDAQCFELQVKDTGLGIKPEDLPRLFDAFEQLGRGASGHPEGTGLGLALTKKLVELQGGRIEVESQYGQGSTFSVLLPRGLTQQMHTSGIRVWPVQGKPCV